MEAKVLIANRGEIALRIIRTCRKLGIRTVVTYSDPDRNSLPLSYADEVYPLRGSTPAETYLNFPKIIEAAKKKRCDAIHPGYGFLAEDAEFVRECERSGILFIGPSSRSLTKLGNKITARQTMKDANVPLIPGSDEPVKDEQAAVDFSETIGYPVILKAVFGGGGKGMRIASNAEEVRRYYRLTKLESLAAFGREAIYVEKRLTKPRHIEVQVIADAKSKIISLGERECSLQRRHQKLLEEAPSIAVTDNLRRKLVESAKAGLSAAGYTNAGTVEFLVDQDGDFYFLEVNKRLQVEHLVTELTTGIDIVEEQLHVTFESSLTASENEIRIRGWAINCRINAEDPRINFTPTPGTVVRYQPPAGPGVRVDSALFSGCEIPEFYDSMVAKLATWGRDRAEALERMKYALREMEVFPIPTTIPLHDYLMHDPNFINGKFDTEYVDQILPKMNSHLQTLEVLAAVASTAHKMMKPSPRTIAQPERARSRWRDHIRSHETRNHWR